MDWPHSVPGVALQNGKFTDGNPLLGIPASLDPAAWANQVTQELVNVITAAGLAPSEAQSDQLLNAIKVLQGGAFTSISADTVLAPGQAGLVVIDASAGNRLITLPDADVGVVDIIVRRLDNTGNRLTISASGTDRIKFHTHLNANGYPFLVLMGAGDWWHLRSDGAGNWWPIGRFDSTVLGRPVFDTTTAFPAGGYGALNGSILVRADWPWLWDHAQQSGMLTTEAARTGMEGGWTSGDGATTFRVPELRGEFVRALDQGRGVDVGRVAGSSQSDSIKAHSHAYGATHNANFGMSNFPQIGVNPSSQTAYQTAQFGGTETRPRSIALPARFKLI